MIIDAYATDTTPSHEVRRRVLEALTNEGEPMSEVTYDALRKRLAEAEAEAAKLREVLHKIIYPRGIPESDLERAVGYELMDDAQRLAYKALGEKE